jgi:hypothetical protein
MVALNFDRLTKFIDNIEAGTTIDEALETEIGNWCTQLADVCYHYL